MGRSYSLDLRKRLIDRVAGGQSRRGAAEDLAVSASFAVKLAARHEQTGSLEPAPQGRPLGTGKLDPYRDFLIGRVREKPDITMPELAAELEAQHGVAADPASLSRYLCKVGFSYKKNAAGSRTRSI
jgi:transposase